MGKPRANKQDDLTVGEVFHLWNHLAVRYEIQQTTDILANFIKDEGLKKIDLGISVLQEQSETLEELLLEYKIPFPERCPKDSETIVKTEIINDRYIYQHIRSGIKSMIPSEFFA